VARPGPVVRDTFAGLVIPGVEGRGHDPVRPPRQCVAHPERRPAGQLRPTNESRARVLRCADAGRPRISGAPARVGRRQHRPHRPAPAPSKARRRAASSGGVPGVGRPRSCRCPPVLCRQPPPERRQGSPDPKDPPLRRPRPPATGRAAATTPASLTEPYQSTGLRPSPARTTRWPVPSALTTRIPWVVE
jgi:hypothetical protein